MSGWERKSDREIWEASGSEPDGFGEIFLRHSGAVYAYCARLTADLSLAEDLTSVVFLQAWSRRGQVRLDHDSALPWLLGVALQVSRNARRSLRRYRAALTRMPAADPEPDLAERVTERLSAERQLCAALDVLQSLPARERDVVGMVLWAGLSYDQAAVALGVPVGTVRSRLSRARSRIRDHTVQPELRLQD